MGKINVVFSLLMVIGSEAIYSQINAGFENGLSGWIPVGEKKNISIDHNHAFEGKSCIRIGPGNAGLEQRMKTLPLSIVQYTFQIKSADSHTSGYSIIRFFDVMGNLLLDYKTDPISSTHYQSTGNYTESPPRTSYSSISLYKDSLTTGYIYIDGGSIDLRVGEPRTKHEPSCNLDQYLKPFWESDTAYDEAVLLYAENGHLPSGKLLDTPFLILSVKSFDLLNTFLPGRDYSIEANRIIMNPSSKMPFRSDTSFDRKTDLAWFNLQSQWIVVSYLHKVSRNGPFPIYKGDKTPRTMAKLRTGSGLRIVAYGMSITRGMDVSGYDTVAPFMPSYIDLFAYRLKKIFGYSNIDLFNAGLPGASVDWGAKYANNYINPLHPDLVILDFGMNDFWRLTPDQFAGYIKSIMDSVSKENPQVEFLLISNMLFDPDYIVDSDKYKDWYLSNIKGYNSKLRQLEKTGVISLDMTSLSDWIYQHKKAKDCLTNPLHPNDYLARWYAQGMVSLFEEKH
jgi:GDSL-like Lipase/Acylhydrolase family